MSHKQAMAGRHGPMVMQPHAGVPRQAVPMQAEAHRLEMQTSTTALSSTARAMASSVLPLILSMSIQVLGS